MQLILRALVPIGVLLLGWIGYSVLAEKEEEKRRPKPAPRIIKTRVIKLERQDFQTVISTNGVVRAHHEASLAAQVSGQV